MGCFCSKEAKRQKNYTVQQEKEAQLRAALLIQKWYRKYTARLEARRRATWQVFQTLEYKNEKDQMSLYNFFNDLLLHGQGEDNILIKSLKQEEKPPDEGDLMSTTSPDDVVVESDYQVCAVTISDTVIKQTIMLKQN